LIGEHDSLFYVFGNVNVQNKNENKRRSCVLYPRLVAGERLKSGEVFLLFLVCRENL
jgi:hypothetical protein